MHARPGLNAHSSQVKAARRERARKYKDPEKSPAKYDNEAEEEWLEDGLDLRHNEAGCPVCLEDDSRKLGEDDREPSWLVADLK